MTQDSHKPEGEKYVRTFSDGDDLRDALPSLRVGQQILYRGILHEVIDAGPEQGRRIKAIPPSPTHSVEKCPDCGRETHGFVCLCVSRNQSSAHSVEDGEQECIWIDGNNDCRFNHPDMEYRPCICVGAVDGFSSENCAMYGPPKDSPVVRTLQARVKELEDQK